MLRDTAVSLIATRCGNRTDLDARIVLELQAAQERLEADAFLPWFLVSEIATAVLTINQEQVTFPTDFIRELEDDDSVFWVVDTDGAEHQLDKADYKWMRQKFPDPGRPQTYTILGKYFRFRPVPDAAYSVKFIFYQKDDVLSTNIENDWLKYASGLLIAEAGAAVAAFIGDAAALTLFSGQVGVERSKLINMDTARREANRSRTMGED